MTLLEPVRWSRQRWLTVIGALLFVQLGLIFYLGEPPQILPRAMRSRTAVNLAVDPLSADSLKELATIDDPALFALPSLQGFSGIAWLTFSDFERPSGKWTDAPTYLALDVGGLGETFSSFVQSNGPSATPQMPRPAPELVNVQISVPPLAARTASEVNLDVDGGSGRRLLDRIEVPAWPGEELLKDTVVQLVIDDSGNALSAVLRESSGSKGADEFALKQASMARFEPIRNRPSTSTEFPCTFENLLFRWYTVPPQSGTNVISAQR